MTRRPWVVSGVSLAVAVAMLAGSCGSGAPSGTIVVSAASSLGPAFERIAEEFTAVNPDVKVDLNLDGSSSLATQVLEGAPVDVFASADVVTMERVVDAGLLASSPQVFATNELVIVTRPENPAGIRTLEDLEGAGIVALCGAEVPCGRYAQQVLASAGVRLDESMVTRGQNAGATLTAVAQGDAVAAIVYVTDVIGAGDAVTSLTIPDAVRVLATYPIAIVSTSSNERAARAFVDWVVGPDGQAVLAQLGFGPPP